MQAIPFYSGWKLFRAWRHTKILFKETSMKIAILGANGLIGQSVTHTLASAGKDVTLFDRKISDSLKQFPYTIGDLSDVDAIDRFLSDGIDTVIHLISTTVPVTAERHLSSDVQGNLLGTLGLLDACVRNSVRRFIFPSSGGTVYGPIDSPASEDTPRQPVCSYGIVKCAIEDYLRLYRKRFGLDYLVLRIANPYGAVLDDRKEQGVIGVFMNRVARGLPLEVWGDGEVIRDFIHVNDVGRAFAAAVDYHGDERIFNIGTGTGTSLNQIIDMIKTIIGRPVDQIHSPQNSFDVPMSVLVVDRVLKEMGWRADISLADGLALAYKHLQDTIAVDCL